MSHQQQAGLAEPFVLSQSSGAADIVTAKKVSLRTAQAAPVAQSNDHPKVSSVESRKRAQSNDLDAAAGASYNSSPRSMPSPIPPPSAALPPLLGLSSPSTRNQKLSPVVAQSNSPRDALKTAHHLNTGLSPSQHAELVQLLLSELRPAHIPTRVKSTSRSHSARKSSRSAAAANMSQSKSSRADDSPRGSPAAITSSLHADRANNDKSDSSELSTPQLSQSRSLTPTSPAIVKAQDTLTEPSAADALSDVLTPRAALESLRVLENSFKASSPGTPLVDDFSKDSVLSQNTAVSSPTKVSASERQGRVSPSNSSGSASSTKVKRNSSYCKSVPRLEDLETGLGISDHRDGAPLIRSPTTYLPRSTTPRESPKESSSWLSSLSTMEAIRVLAQQKSIADIRESKSTEVAAASEPATDAGQPTDEVNALRYALTFALLRADTLAETLKRVGEEKIKAENELEILRRNVLQMLGSNTMFPAPTAVSTRSCQESIGGRFEASHSIHEEDDAVHFEDAVSRQPHGAAHPAVSPVRKDKKLVPQPRDISRPSKAERAVKAVSIAPEALDKPKGGVSIASLRKNNPTIAVSAPPPQRYDASRSGHGGDDNHASKEEEDEDDEDDDSFEMYPFAPPRRALPEVSMSDFLNASRMSKSEIQEHDARRELERSGSNDTEHNYSYSSTSSRSALTGSQSMRSFDINRRGFFKNITSKLVDGGDKTRRLSLASKPSIASLAPPSAGLARSSSARGASNFAMVYQEESIIPSYRGQKSASMSGGIDEAGEKVKGERKARKSMWAKTEGAFSSIPLI